MVKNEVDKRFNPPEFSRKKDLPTLSGSKFARLSLLLGLGATFAEACVATGINVVPVVPVSPEPSAPATSQAPEAIPTQETVPQSILEQMPLLEKHGYTLQEAEIGWELVDAQGQVVLSTTEPLTISARAGNNEILLVPSTSFLVRETVAAGVPIILTFKDSTSEANTAHFYLERTGEWATPIEIYNDFENLEQCPKIDIEDVWSGRLLYSEALVAEPFPNGTLVPDEFLYGVRQLSGGYEVLLSDRVNGLTDEEGGMTTRGVNKDNDYRQYENCALSVTPNGEEILITTEKVLWPDGKTLAFFHSGYGQEWSWSEGHPYASQNGGALHSVKDSILLAKTKPPQEGSASLNMRPIVHFDFPQAIDINKFYGPVEQGNPDTAGVALYFLPQNDPLELHPEIKEQLASIGDAGENAMIPAGEEIAEFQYMLLLSNWPVKGAVPPGYFNP